MIKRHRIRELVRPVKPSLIERLEARAQAMKAKLSKRSAPTPRSVLEQDIAFVAEQLDRIRQIHKEQIDSIRREEFELEQRLHRLNPEDFASRETLGRRLAKLSVERRKHIQSHQKHLDRLHEKLIALFAEHDYLR